MKWLWVLKLSWRWILGNTGKKCWEKRYEIRFFKTFTECKRWEISSDFRWKALHMHSQNLSWRYVWEPRLPSLNAFQTEIFFFLNYSDMRFSSYVSIHSEMYKKSTVWTDLNSLYQVWHINIYIHDCWCLKYLLKRFKIHQVPPNG